MSDNEEELVNYSQLTSKKKSKHQKSDQDQTAHAQEALFQCLENKGRLQKSICQGIVESGGVRITVSKGTHLHTVGFSHQGHIRLHPEEAAFLVSRNALVVCDGDRVLDFEDLVELIVDDVWLTLDKYQVYAYLKRLGYIVMRAKMSGHVRDPVPTLETRYQMIAQSDHTKLLIALVGDTEGVLFYQTMGNTVHDLV
ncbi:tRNA splicing endonuclease 54 [Rhizopus stolonifer]|uniref:tRNA splicing endonuclease 54 n=1 Tax=Rhizopus stolonifer TaxID=4846 RepID=A0A367KXB3_RHIST|nr:tRNA splicing endonuclease 54 [Rhizopus stolonifer]